MSKRKLIIIMRMPKTGSTTLTGIAHTVYGKKTFHGNPNQVLQLSLEERAKLDIVSGHLRYGFHDQMWKPYIYITMLREPVDRVISHYYHLLDHDSHILHVTAKSMSFQEYVLRPDAEKDIANIQTKFLSGYFHVRNPRGVVPLYENTPSPKELLQLAIEHLDTFIYGITERFEESLMLFHKQLGWPQLAKWGNYRVRAHRPRVVEIPYPTIDAIRERNQLDIQLYRHAAFEFEKRLRKVGL